MNNIKMVFSPSKMLDKSLKTLFQNKLSVLFICIVVVIVGLLVYRNLFSVKENFVSSSLDDMLNGKVSNPTIMVNNEQKSLLRSATNFLGIPILNTAEEQLSRILNLEGLCSDIQEPLQLPEKEGNGSEGCGWYFKENPDHVSFPAYGNSTGPLNPALKDIAKHGKWYFTNLDEAQKNEDIKRCSKIRTCELTDLYPKKCAWCDSLGYSIPIDSNRRSLYPEEDRSNCQGKLTYTVDKCPPLMDKAVYQTDSSGKIIDTELVPPPVCDLVEGKLTPDCLLFLAEGAGIKKNSAVYRVINGDPDGYLIINTYAHRKFKIAFEIMRFRSGINFDPEIIGGGKCKREAALKYFVKLVKQTAYGFNPRTRAAAEFLVGDRDDFQPYDNDLNSIGPFAVDQLQTLFKEAGGQPAGLAYPSDENMNRYNGNKLGKIINSFQKTCNTDIKSGDPDIQTDAIKQCLGINVTLPIAGRDKPVAPYIANSLSLITCNAGNPYIGNVSTDSKKGVEVFWYSFDNDLTVPERRQQVATYFGRQIKASMPSVTQGSIPYKTSTPVGFMARTNITHSGPDYNAQFIATASEGVAIKVNSNTVLRNWAVNTKGSGTSNAFQMATNSSNLTEIYWFSTNPITSSFLISLVDGAGQAGPVPTNSCFLRVKKGYPVARWDFYTGDVSERNNVLASVSANATVDLFQNYGALVLNGQNSYVMTTNKIAGSAFRSFTAMLYYTGIGKQGSNRIFTLRKSNGVDSDETTNWNRSVAIEAGITNTGAVFASLKPDSATSVNLLTAATPIGTVTPNTWFHVAVTYSLDYSTVTIYINGVKQATATGNVDTSYYHNMIFDYGSIGMGYANSTAFTSDMALKGGMAWQHWFDYTLCPNDVNSDMANNFCNKTVYPNETNGGWPHPC